MSSDLLSRLESLSPAEKQEAMDYLWRDLQHSPEPLQISNEVGDEVRRRLEELLQAPEQAVPHDEMWRRIRRSSGDA